MKIKYPDYHNCIANLPNSILKRFNVELNGESLPSIDRVLSSGRRNVVVLLLDGMGQVILENNLNKKGFFRSNIFSECSSVFLSTTVAATTSMDSGLMPSEHSWLGWFCYYPQIDQNISVFNNTIQNTDIKARSYRVADTYCPYESVVTKLNRNGRKAYYATLYKSPFPQSFDEIKERIISLCKTREEKYVYAYWREPDSTMHTEGCFSEKSKDGIRTLEKEIEFLTKELKDTTLIITADHGFVDIQCISITRFPTIMNCLVQRFFNIHILSNSFLTNIFLVECFSC